jgi:hypothetical protein
LQTFVKGISTVWAFQPVEIKVGVVKTGRESGVDRMPSLCIPAGAGEKTPSVPVAMQGVSVMMGSAAHS